MEKIVIETLDFTVSKILPRKDNENLKINELLAEGWQIQKMEQAIVTSSKQEVDYVILTFWLKTTKKPANYYKGEPLE